MCSLKSDSRSRDLSTALNLSSLPYLEENSVKVVLELKPHSSINLTNWSRFSRILKGNNILTSATSKVV